MVGPMIIVWTFGTLRSFLIYWYTYKWPLLGEHSQNTGVGIPKHDWDLEPGTFRLLKVWSSKVYIDVSITALKSWHFSEIHTKFVLPCRKVSIFISFKFFSDIIDDHICSEVWWNQWQPSRNLRRWVLMCFSMNVRGKLAELLHVVQYKLA